METWTLSIGTSTQLTILPPKPHFVSTVFGLAACQGIGHRAQSTGRRQNGNFASNCYSCPCLHQWLCFKWLEPHRIWHKPPVSLEGKWEAGRSVHLGLEPKYWGPVGLIETGLWKRLSVRGRWGTRGWVVLMLWQQSRKKDGKCAERTGETAYWRKIAGRDGCITSFHWKIL